MIQLQIFNSASQITLYFVDKKRKVLESHSGKGVAMLAMGQRVGDREYPEAATTITVLHMMGGGGVSQREEASARGSNATLIQFWFRNYIYFMRPLVI